MTDDAEVSSWAGDSTAAKSAFGRWQVENREAQWQKLAGQMGKCGQVLCDCGWLQQLPSIYILYEIVVLPAADTTGNVAS